MSAKHSRIIRNRTKGTPRGWAADGAMVDRATERSESASKSGREVAAGIGTAARERVPQLTGENTSTFKAVALKWIGSKKGNGSPLYLKRVERGLAADVFPFVGHLPLHSITADDILQVLNRVIDRGTVVVAMDVRRWCASVFRYGVSIGHADFDPVSRLRAAIIRPPVTHVQPLSREQLRDVFLKLPSYSGPRAIYLALRVMLYTFVRVGEIRNGAWEDVKFDDALWVIRADRAKSRHEHQVPLSRQAIAVLRELHEVTGAGEHMFPDSRRPEGVMSATTFYRVTKHLGIPVGSHVIRGTVVQHLRDMGWDDQLVAMQMMGVERRQAKAFPSARSMHERREMMQAWADWLDAFEADAVAGS